MRRVKWVQFALIMTLFAAILIGNTLALGGSMIDRLEDRASDTPPRPRFYDDAEVYIIGGLTALSGASVAMSCFGWARVRRHGVPEKAAKEAGVELQLDQDGLDRPPGFGGPRIRKKRKGLAPLLSFTFLGLLLIAIGGILVALGLITLDQTVGHDGRSHKRAVLFAGLTKWLGIPVWWLGSGMFWLAWGRWFPLGQVEIIVEEDAQGAGSGFTWQSD